jgi:hypothetical protein
LTAEIFREVSSELLIVTSAHSVPKMIFSLVLC